MARLKKNIKKLSFLGNYRGEKFSILASNRMLEIWKIEERCEVCLNLTIRTPEQPQWGRPAVFVVYFGHGRLWTKIAWFWPDKSPYTANICLFKVNNRTTRKSCQICWKLTMKTSNELYTLDNIQNFWFSDVFSGMDVVWYFYY